MKCIKDIYMHYMLAVIYMHYMLARRPSSDSLEMNKEREKEREKRREKELEKRREGPQE